MAKPQDIDFDIHSDDFTVIELSRLETNDGQLAHVGLPRNPRSIKAEKYQKLKDTLAKYPKVLKKNPIKVFKLDKYLPGNEHYIVLGGNMRLRALRELGFKRVPCIIAEPETPIEELRAIVVIDNNSFGEWDWDMFANEWDEHELDDFGIDLPMTLDEPDDLEEENKDKDFIAKLTFKDADTLDKFKEEFGAMLIEKFDCMMSVSGGEL